MIKYLLFDIDGTLWNSTSIVAKGWNRAIRELGYSKAVITPEVLRKEFGQPMNVIADHLFADVNDPERRQELLERCCVYEHLYLEENEEDISYPQMRETMRRLSEKYKLYIVSNCQRGYIELVMKKNKISDLIADYDCFGNTGAWKGETIRLVMERNQIPKSEAVYIGDITGDQEAAAHAGILFIHAAYGFGTVENAAASIGNLAELETVLENVPFTG